MNFKDDELRTSCVYTSTDRVGYTFGGQSSSEEMWLSIIICLKKMKTLFVIKKFTFQNEKKNKKF